MKKLSTLVLGLMVASMLVAFAGCAKTAEPTADGTGDAGTASNVKGDPSGDE